MRDSPVCRRSVRKFTEHAFTSLSLRNLRGFCVAALNNGSKYSPPETQRTQRQRREF
jgi:hypothetical protein